MELVERWAYYGVRMILSLYIVSAASSGGLEFSHIQKGQIYSGWALVQSILPILTGSYSDKFGYRRTIFLAILLKVIGYILMATQTSFGGFFGGCMLLAAGTAIFKPAVQGVLASTLNKENSSLGWGIFYWLINVGGFLGPWLAGYLRQMDWQYVFYVNALIVSLNFFILFICPPNTANKEEQNLHKEDSSQHKNKSFVEFFSLPFTSIKELFQPELFLFLLIYSGFWMMYNQIFDLLPNFIDDWVGTNKLLYELGSFFNISSWLAMAKQNKGIPPEWLISINTATITLLMLPASWLIQRVNLFASMVIGTLLTLLGTYLFGCSQVAWLCVAGIIVFSIGEMGASPKMREYLGLIAPKGKKSQYLGYANLPEAIGWGFGSLIAGYWYEAHSDKHNLAKQYLTNKLGWSPAQVNSLGKDSILETLGNALNLDQSALSKVLWDYGDPQKIWLWFIAIGLITAVGLVIHYQFLSDKFKLKEIPAEDPNA
jgi:proton-dependent oligopeptide transporter, POT family